MTRFEAAQEFDRQAETLSVNLKSLRKYRGMSMTALSKESGVSRNCIYMIESKHRTSTLYTALMLCLTLGIDLGEMLKEKREDLYAWDSYFSSLDDDGGNDSGDGIWKV